MKLLEVSMCLRSRLYFLMKVSCVLKPRFAMPLHLALPPTSLDNAREILFIARNGMYNKTAAYLLLSGCFQKTKQIASSTLSRR